MTFGSDVSRFCQSTISSPVVAHAFITTTEEGNKSTIEVYEIPTVVTGAQSTISNLTSLATGLAVADPVVVAWALQDMSSFPSDYRTSLASKIGIALVSGATPASSSSLPKETEDSVSTANPPLSTGAKAGMGVGIAVGVAVIAGILGLFWLRRRKRNQIIIAEMADQDETNARRRWFLGGRWRNEAEVRPTPTQELDSKAVRIVPGPPAELDSAQV